MNKLNVEKKIADLNLGTSGELDVLEILKLRHGDNVKQFTRKYAPFDYYVTNDNNEIIKEYELKTRRCGIKTYPTLAFGLNKLEYADKRNKENVETSFLWNLNEGLYEWDYNGTQTYEVSSICNKARNDKPHDAVYVDTKFIKPFNNQYYMSFH